MPSPRIQVAATVAASVAATLLCACAAGPPAPPAPKRLSFARAHDAGQVADAIAAAETWLLANLLDGGTFVYLYDPRDDLTSASDNMARQFLAARTLAQMSEERAQLVPLHQKNIDSLLANHYREDDSQRGYILRKGMSKLGANALALRALARSPRFDAYQRQARALADGVLSLLNQDGSFRPWFVAPKKSDTSDERLLTFYTGEAILALLEYADRAQAPSYRDAAVRAQEHYLVLYVDRLEENYYPAYVPWHTQSLAYLYRQRREPRLARAIFRLNDTLLELLDRTRYVGRFADPRRPDLGGPHSSADAVYIESLAHALDVAIDAGDAEHIVRYSDALEIAVPNLLSLQFREPVPGYRGPPAAYVGGVRTNIDNAKLRIDNTAHAVDALKSVLTAVRRLPDAR